MSYGQLNPHFNFYTYTPEQDFYADFIDEEIRITGTEVLYIPKTFESIDEILGEPIKSLHNKFYPMPARITNVEGYTGNPDMMTTLGVQFQPESEWVISKRIFKSMKIPDRELRPHEGDLLLVGPYQSSANDPIWTNSLFEMTYVKRDTPNWPLGRYYVWSINCQLYQVSYERFNTGNTHIDRITTQYSNEEDIKQGINNNLDSKKVSLVDFDETNPFSGL
jgi:hypothetical protein